MGFEENSKGADDIHIWKKRVGLLKIHTTASDPPVAVDSLISLSRRFLGFIGSVHSYSIAILYIHNRLHFQHLHKNLYCIPTSSNLSWLFQARSGETSRTTLPPRHTTKAENTLLVSTRDTLTNAPFLIPQPS